APRSPGVRNGRPRAMSKTRNQTATTAAPIKPATTPSFRTDRSADAICVRIIVCLPGSLGVAREPHAVVGIAQVRLQRRAVRHRAPRVGVTPGPSAADAPGARRRPPRIARRRAGIVAVLEPVGAPFVTDTRDVGEPERIHRRRAHARRTVERDAGPLVAPGKTPVLEAPTRGLLPLGLGR